MKSLYDVQEWLKKYGYINLMPERSDAIYLMQEEVKNLHSKGILADGDRDYISARLILRREARIEQNRK